MPADKKIRVTVWLPESLWRDIQQEALSRTHYTGKKVSATDVAVESLQNHLSYLGTTKTKKSA